ncbi:hypothetical protein GC207_08685 [bacterium]|nr:hypothetical protein [bacterium]
MISKGSLFAFVATSVVLGCGTSAFGQNAAPLYRKAFRYEQRLQKEFPDQARRFEVWKKVMQKRDFDEEARRYLDAIAPELDQAVAASKMPTCRWNEDFYQGYVMSVAKCKSLAKVLIARMILRSKDGEIDGGLADFMAVIRMSDQFEGEYRSTIGLILKRETQWQVIQEYAKVLPQKNQAALIRLTDFWSQHQSDYQWELGDSLREETHRTFAEIQKQLTNGRAVSDIKKWMLESGGFNTKAPLLEAANAKADLEPVLQKLQTQCLRIADVLDQQDVDRFNEELRTYMNDYAGTPVARAGWFAMANDGANSLRIVYEKAKMTEIATAMFDLAVKRSLNGDAALESVKDPATGRRFIVRPTEAGYLIESAFAGRKKPIQLQVGDAR